MLRGLFRGYVHPFIRPFFSAGLEYRQPHNLNINAWTRTYGITSPANILPENGRHHKPIRNFDPLRILPEDYVDSFVYQDRFSFKVFHENEYADSITQLKYAQGVLPDGCRGFLYFYEDPKQLQMSGIRFRICAKATQESFHAGKDLLKYQSNTPWTISVIHIALSKWGTRLLEKLCQDGLVDRLALGRWLQSFKAAGISPHSAMLSSSRCKILTSLEEPFEIQLDKITLYNVVFPEEAQVARFSIVGLKKHHPLQRPYKGKCLIRLENIMDATKRLDRKAFSYNIRIIKILTPIECTIPDYDGAISMPKEGSLVLKNGSPLRWKASFYTVQRADPSSQLQIEEKIVSGVHGRQFSTLDPDKLGPQDFIDISDCKSPVVYASANSIKTGLRFQSGHVDRTSGPTNRILLHFSKVLPLGTHGFFYWYRDPHSPEISAEVRFRVAPTASREGFSLGQDLIFPGSNRLWSLPLLRLFTDKYQFGPLFVAQAVHDGLISQEFADKCQRIVQSDWYRGFPKTARVIYAYNQPFTQDFACKTSPIVYIIDHEGCVIWRTEVQSTFRYGNGRARPIFYGKCVLRLEPVVDEGQANARDSHLQLHIRVIKILEPTGFVNPDCRRTDQLQEGSLISRNGWPIVIEAAKFS